jgi:putative hydrolase of the HAD superfamily
MEKDYLPFIRKFLGESEALYPAPTLLKPLIKHDPSIRAVLFDVYGTILISASGDIDEFVISTENLKKSFEHAGIEIHALVTDPVKLLISILESFKSAIGLFHEAERTEDKPFPEIDILAIWEEILIEHVKNKQLVIPDPLCIKCFTFVFEVLSNRIYPMPGMSEVITSLSEKMPLGIISNAQFYTPVILNYFLHKTVADSETVPPFDSDLTVFSYQVQRSKPDPFLFEKVKQQIRRKYDIFADEVLFVGNDMYRDVYPASLSGFKTALFAGDTRSLRLRQDHSELKSITPDYILTDLRQLLQIIT